MTTFARTLLLSLDGVVGLVGIAVVWAAFAFGVVGWPWVWKDVSLLATPEWASPAGHGSRLTNTLAIRRKTLDGEVLLLTQDENAQVLGYTGNSGMLLPVEPSGPFAVYQYDPTEDQLSIVPDSAWREAASPVEKCQRGPLLGTARAPNVIRWADRRFTAVGNFIYYGARISPSKTKAAVLSTEGPKSSDLGFWAFGSRDMYWGQHYHQLLSLEDNEFIGEPVRLPFLTTDYSVDVCWSPGEEFVIYFDMEGSWLVLVPTEPS